MNASSLSACAAALLLASLPWASHAANEGPESRIFTQMDFPHGLPFIAADTRVKAVMTQRWHEAQARGGFESYGEPKVNSLGRMERVQISPNHPVPATALGRGLESQVWNEFWVLRSESAVEGKQDAPRAMATRYALRCQPLAIMELGWLSFTTLDASGEPRSVLAEYNRVRSAGIYKTSTPNHMTRVQETCGKELAALDQQQADLRAKERAERVEDLQKVLAVRLHKALDPDTAMQIGALFRASMAPAPNGLANAGAAAAASSLVPLSASSSASSPASEPAPQTALTPEANAQAAEAAMNRLKALQQDPTVFDSKGEPRPARLRLFGVNGGAAFLHKGAACYSEDTQLQVAGGF